MRDRWVIVAWFELIACTGPGVRASSPGSSARKESIVAVAELHWTGAPLARDLAASESGTRAIDALMERDRSGLAILVSCTLPVDKNVTYLAFLERAMPFARRDRIDHRA